MAGILGLILAGGQATRFGGGDKSRQLFHGLPLLAHVETRLRPQVDTLTLSANGDPSRFSDFEMTVLADPLHLHKVGPVAGLVAGLTYATAHGFDFVLTAPCDAPLLPSDLAERLSSALHDPHYDCARAASGDQIHPVFALWRTCVLEPVLQLSADNVRALWRLQTAIATVDISFSASPFDPFSDADTPDDLRQLESLSQDR